MSLCVYGGAARRAALAWRARVALFGMAAACAAVALSACQLDLGPQAGQLASASPTLRLRFLALSAADVAGVQYQVTCDDGTTLASYIPLEDEGLPPWLLPAGAGAGHAFADLLAVVPAGQTCHVTATPMQAPGVPSTQCAPASASILVQPGVTTEVVLMMQCQGDPAGAIDVVAGLNFPPIISGLGLLPSKFILACEPVIIAPLVSDPDGDPVQVSLTLISSPAGANPTLTPLPNGQWSFVTDVPGPYGLELTATDVFGATTSLSFPLHVSPGDLTLCGAAPTPACCQLPDGTIQDITDLACAAAAGQIVPAEQCQLTCCPYDEIDARYEPPGTCTADEALPNAQCEEVCCFIPSPDGELDTLTRTRQSCDMQAGTILNEGPCVPTVCCQLPDGSWGQIDAAQCAAAVSASLCDLSPTCCVQADLSVINTTVSACVAGGGQVSAEGCEQCALLPAGPGVFDSCVGVASPTPNPWDVVSKVLWSDPDTSQIGLIAKTPLVARLIDTNGDGALDTLDDPYLIIMGAGATLHVVNAATGATAWTRQGLMFNHQPAVAALTTSSPPSILVLDKDGYLLALSPAGVTQWASSFSVVPNVLSSPAIQPEDLDRDGRLEIVVGSMILDDGGALVRVLPAGPARGRVALGDYDLDGVTEVVMTDGVYDPFSGLREVTLPVPSHYHALLMDTWVQADHDPQAELARLGGSRLAIYDHQGSLLRQSTNQSALGLGHASGPFYSSWFGAPCAGDFDGDGVTDLVSVTNPAVGFVPGSLRVGVTNTLTADTLMIELPRQAAWASCSMADLDGDGRQEILLSAGGLTILSADPSLLTPIAYEDLSGGVEDTFDAQQAYPVVADLDQDGASDIVAPVIVAAGAHRRLEIVKYRHTSGQWQDHGPSWQVTDYHTLRLSELQSQTMPASVTPWLEPQGVMQSKVLRADGADLVAQIEGVCITSCAAGQPATLSVRVLNTGSMPHAGAVTVRVFANAGGSPAGPALQTLVIPGPFAVASASASVALSVDVADIGPDGLIVEVDSGSADCRPDNDRTIWAANPCD